jgi:hypothetical protein
VIGGLGYGGGLVQGRSIAAVEPKVRRFVRLPRMLFSG